MATPHAEDGTLAPSSPAVPTSTRDAAPPLAPGPSAPAGAAVGDEPTTDPDGGPVRHGRAFVPWPTSPRPDAAGRTSDRSGPAGVGPRARLSSAFDAVSAWLPMLLMVAMALGSWWLVRSTPSPEVARASAPPRHEPDSTMNAFLVQRFAPDGPLRVEIQGERMRHYPDTDTYEIDAARIRSIGADGRVTLASARTAVANRDASEVQLSGGAHVVREATATDAAIDFRGEFLDVIQSSEQLRSHLPVVVTQGGHEVHADAMRYDNLTRTVELRGHVRAVLAPNGRPAGSPAASR